MALESEVGFFAAPTSTGQDTVSLTDSGHTPKILILWITPETGPGSGTFAEYGYGATDGTREGCLTGTSQDSSGSGKRHNHAQDDKCIAIWLQGDPATLQAEAEVVSFGAGEFVLDWTTVNAAYKVGYLVIGGSSLTDQYVGTLVGTGDQTVTAPGFQGDALIALAQDRTALFNTQYANAVASIGAAVSSTNRWCSLMRARGTSAYGTGSSTETTLVAGGHNDGVGLETAWDFSAWTATGFNLVEDTASNEVALVYIVLEIADVDVGTTTQPTSAGEVAESGFGFEPTCVLFGSGCKPSSAVDGEICFGAAAKPDGGAIVEGSMWFQVDNGQGVDSDRVFSETKCLIAYDAGTPTLEAEADLKTFDSGGFTLDYTTADANARINGYIALGPAAAAAANPALVEVLLRQQAAIQTRFV